MSASTREIVTVGWDGASQPMRRYRDELHLPDHERAVPPPDEYTHTIYSLDADGKVFSACVGRVVDGKVLRSNAVTCTYVEDTPAYHERFMARGGSGHSVVAVEGVAWYRKFIGGVVADLDHPGVEVLS